MKYKVITLITAFQLAACGADDANDVIDNIQNDGDYAKVEADEEAADEPASVAEIRPSQTSARTVIQTSSTATEEVAVLPMTGVLSFLPDDFVFECTDYSRGVSESVPMQLEYEIEDGFITVQQSSSQRTSTVQGMNPTSEVISSSVWSGPISKSGEFDITGTSVILDYKWGTMRTSYRITGEFTDDGWQGEYTMTVSADELFVTCYYDADFDGERVR